MFVTPEPGPTPLLCWLVPIDGSQRGAVILLGVLTRLGSDPNADVVINAPGVGNEHCMISLSPVGVFLRALDESLDTLVDGCSIVGEVEIEDGQQISLSGFRFVFKCSLTRDEYKAHGEQL